MSAIEKAKKIAGNEGRRTPPRFASHTQSSLMKKRTPINLRRKLSSTAKERESRSVIFKRRTSHGRSQSRSVVALRMVLDQRHRATRSISGCVLTETTRQTKQYAEDLLVSLQDDLIKDISWNIIKCTRSPIKLASRIVSRSEKQAENPNEDSLDVTCAVSSVSFQEELDSKSTSGDSTVADTASKSRSSEEDGQEESEKSSQCEEDDVISIIDIFQHERENDKEPQTLAECETQTLKTNDDIQVLHQRSHRRCKKTDDSLSENNLETQVCQQTAANRTKYTQKIWKKRKTKTQNEEVDNGEPRDSANPKIMKQVDDSRNTRSIANNDAKYARKKGGQRNFSFIYRRAWRPAGIGGRYSNAENTESSTQLASHKSQFRSAEKSGTSIKNKHSPVEQVKSFDSESTNAPMSASQFKENRDPRDRAAKTICEQAAEAKEQLDQQRKAMQKRKLWTTRKVNSGNEAGSRSRWQHWRSFTPRSPKESNEQQQNCVLSEPAKIGGRRSRPAEVIHALKEIIDSVSDDPEENVASASKTDVFRESKTNPEMPRNDDGLHFAATGDQTTRRSFKRSLSPDVFRRTIGTQTELNSDSDLIDPGRISKLQMTQTVATQTTPPCGGGNIVEIGCNTMPYCVNTCQDAEVSCDLIGLSNVKTAPSTIETENNTAIRSPPIITRIYDSDNDAILDSDSICDDSDCEKREEVPSDIVIENIKTVYELATRHARNLHDAAMIVSENLMSREKQRDEIQGDDETPFRTTCRDRDRCARLERCGSLTSSASVDEIGSEHGDGERLVTGDDSDLDELSVCSITSSSERTFVSVIRNSRADVADLADFDRAEGSENAQVARSSLNVPVVLEDMRSVMRLLMRRAQEERVFEILRFGGDNEERAEKPPIVSLENLLPLVCCALCVLVIWWLPFSFRCQTDA